MNDATGSADPTVSLFHIRRKDYWFGQWFRRSSGYPTWFGRLVRVGHVTVEREINEQYIAYGESKFLTEHLLHYPFNKGVVYWLERHNRYSSMEAVAQAEDRRQKVAVRGLWSRDPIVRRKTMKQIAYRLPARPFLTFCYLYVARGGFLDGRAGLRYCILRAMYEYMIDVKVKERVWNEETRKREPKTIFVNRYFSPDHSATSQLLSDLAFDLASRGQDIHVITGGQLYTDLRSVAPFRGSDLRGARTSRAHLAIRTRPSVGPDARLSDILSRCNLAIAPLDPAGRCGRGQDRSPDDVGMRRVGGQQSKGRPRQLGPGSVSGSGHFPGCLRCALCRAHAETIA